MLVLPLIITAMILAVQNLKEMSKGGAKLARWTLLYYVLTTVFSVIHSQILVDVAWRKLMVVVGDDALRVSGDDQETIDENSGNAAHDIIVEVAESFIPNNVVAALAEDSLLAVLVTAVIVGCLIRGPAENSPLLRAVKEIDRIVAKIITFLIALAPIGVFFLILANLMTLDMEDIGQNLGVLIGASIASMFIQLFIVFPILYFAFVRQNPYSYWLKNSPAWITAWGSASSAATLPVTLRCLNARGVPTTVSKFTAPLGALINMVSLMVSRIHLHTSLMRHSGRYRNILPNRGRLLSRHPRNHSQRRRLYNHCLACNPVIHRHDSNSKLFPCPNSNDRWLRWHSHNWHVRSRRCN